MGWATDPSLVITVGTTACLAQNLGCRKLWQIWYKSNLPKFYQQFLSQLIWCDKQPICQCFSTSYLSRFSTGKVLCHTVSMDSEQLIEEHNSTNFYWREFTKLKAIISRLNLIHANMHTNHYTSASGNYKDILLVMNFNCNIYTGNVVCSMYTAAVKTVYIYSVLWTQFWSK